MASVALLSCSRKASSFVFTESTYFAILSTFSLVFNSLSTRSKVKVTSTVVKAEREEKGNNIYS